MHRERHSWQLQLLAFATVAQQLWGAKATAQIGQPIPCTSIKAGIDTLSSAPSRNSSTSFTVFSALLDELNFSEDLLSNLGMSTALVPSDSAFEQFFLQAAGDGVEPLQFVRRNSDVMKQVVLFHLTGEPGWSTGLSGTVNTGLAHVHALSQEGFINTDAICGREDARFITLKYARDENNMVTFIEPMVRDFTARNTSQICSNTPEATIHTIDTVMSPCPLRTLFSPDGEFGCASVASVIPYEPFGRLAYTHSSDTVLDKAKHPNFFATASRDTQAFIGSAPGFTMFSPTVDALATSGLTNPSFLRIDGALDHVFSAHVIKGQLCFGGETAEERAVATGHPAVPKAANSRTQAVLRSELIGLEPSAPTAAPVATDAAAPQGTEGATGAGGGDAAAPVGSGLSEAVSTIAPPSNANVLGMKPTLLGGVASRTRKLLDAALASGRRGCAWWGMRGGPQVGVQGSTEVRGVRRTDADIMGGGPGRVGSLRHLHQEILQAPMPLAEAGGTSTSSPPEEISIPDVENAITLLTDDFCGPAGSVEIQQGVGLRRASAVVTTPNGNGVSAETTTRVNIRVCGGFVQEIDKVLMPCDIGDYVSAAERARADDTAGSPSVDVIAAAGATGGHREGGVAHVIACAALVFVLAGLMIV